MIVKIKFMKKCPVSHTTPRRSYAVTNIDGNYSIQVSMLSNTNQRFTIPEFVIWAHMQYSILRMWIELDSGQQFDIGVDPLTYSLDQPSREFITNHTLKRPDMSIENINIPSTPITPADIKRIQESGELIPEFVIRAVNRLLIENATVTGTSITLKLEDVKRAIHAEKRGITEQFDSRWLDFEPFFIKQGWGVIYDQPAYNESYPATYTFKMNK